MPLKIMTVTVRAIVSGDVLTALEDQAFAYPKMVEKYEEVSSHTSRLTYTNGSRQSLNPGMNATIVRERPEDIGEDDVVRMLAALHPTDYRLQVLVSQAKDYLEGM
jgi:hypothetical protein